MEFKGTKGFWTVREYYDDEYDQPAIDIDSSENIEGLATVWSGLEGNTICESTKADALLISKAPEMLEMLKKCQIQAIVDENEVLEKEIESLIKSATEL